MIRESRSRPKLGSTPSGWDQLIPPNEPLGLSRTGSTSSWCRALGSRPNVHSMGFERMASRTRSSTTMPPATATLSRLNRIQAI